MNSSHNVSHLSDIPAHVAVIMDGNGRWAKARGLDRTEGHRQGAETVKTIVKAAAKAGVKYLTLYAFSTENWNRPAQEVEAIMNLLVFMLDRETKELHDNHVRLSAIGDLSRLDTKAQDTLKNSMQFTAENKGLHLIIALNYGSRNEILNAVKSLGRQMINQNLHPDAIDEKLFSDHLYTAGIPDPDLLIRTSGEQRISNFLLWQLAYAELYFTPVTWPDFSEEEFLKALHSYANRERRFGLTGEQIPQKNDNTI